MDDQGVRPESAHLCALCPPHRPAEVRTGGVTCWRCHERLGRSIADIADRYPALDAAPRVSPGSGRRAPGFGSRPPLNLHAAALRDPRTAPVRLGDLHSPLNWAITWARWIRTERSQAPVRLPLDELAALDAEVRYLLAALDWITRQPWVTTFADQTRAVRSQLRSATGDPRPRPVGRCTRRVRDDGTGPERACAHPLFPPRPGSSDVVCGACGGRYSPLDQVRMQAAERAA